MGRAQLGCAVYEVGEKGELLFDVAFVPAAIHQGDGARFPCLREGDGGRCVADVLAPGDDEERFEAREGPRACGEGIFDPRVSRRSAALALERETWCRRVRAGG